jgi:protein-disulfide isomerase
MASKRRDKRPSRAGNTPNAGRSGKQGRPDSKALARAGTRGSAGTSPASLLLWSLAFVAIAAIVVAIVVLLQSKGGAVLGGPTAPSVVTPGEIPSNGRTLGNPNAPVTIDLYGDFRCSACFNFTVNGTEKSLVDNYIATGKAKLVWHDYLVIDRIRGGTASRDAANASRCAADQGKFWVMHDWLYANQSPTEDPSAFTAARLSDIGRAAGLDMSKFQPCLDQGAHNADVAAEDAGAPKLVTATPTVFVAGHYVGDPNANLIPTYDQIKAAIDTALASPPASASASSVPSGSAAP